MSKPTDSGKIAQIVEALDEYFKSSPGLSISTRKLKRELSLEEIPKRTWTHAVNRFVSSRDEVILEGRTLVSTLDEWDF